MAKSCKKCSKNVTPKASPGISCVDCNDHWHWKCTGLADKAIAAIKSSNLSWTCGKCKRRSTIIVDAPSVPSLPAATSSSASTTTTALIVELRELLNSATARISQLESQVALLTDKLPLVDSLSSSVTTLDTICNSLEKNNVSETLEVQNLPEEALNDPVETVIQLSHSINCPVSANDFSSAPYREQKRLRLPFKCKNLRRKFLLAGKDFNKKKNQFEIGAHKVKIHINQELTTLQRHLFDSTKRFANSNNYKFVWFDVNGKLLLKKSENSTPVVVHSIETLKDENILPKCPGTSIQVVGLPAGCPE